MRDDQGLREDAAVRPFDPGLDVRALREPMDFEYGPGVFGPSPEMRTLDTIRKSLRDPTCAGPDPVYAIAMDVGREEHRRELRDRHLLFGVVTYAAGRLGEEPVRSQGHVHKVASRSGWSPPELYEIWAGRAVVTMQERAADDPQFPLGRNDAEWMKHTLWFKDGNRLDYKPVQLKPLTVESVPPKVRTF